MRKILARDAVVGGFYKCLNGTKNWKLLSTNVDILSSNLRQVRQYPDGEFHTRISSYSEIYEIAKPEEENSKENTMSTTLYQIVGTETYGTILATNSLGKYVFEVRGTGEVKTVEKNQLEEVIPYTVTIKFLGSDSKTYSFFSADGTVSVGDLIFLPMYNQIVMVTGVNTKSKLATKWLEGTKLLLGEEVKGE